MKNYLKAVFALTVVVIAIIWVLEGVCRYVLTNIYNRDFDSQLLVDNKYNSSGGLLPNKEGIVWGQKFTTDKYGGRSTFIRKKAKRKNKWLFIGDSVTEGVGVSDSSTFAYKASKKSAQAIINLSLIGYSTGDYENVVEHYIPNDSAIKRVTLFYCLNDVYGKVSSTSLPVMSKPGVLGYLNGLLQNNYATYKLLKLFIFRNADRYLQYDLQFYMPGNAIMNEAFATISNMANYCRNNGVPFNVVALPYRGQLANGTADNLQPQALLKQYCNNNNIAFADATPYLANINDPMGLYLFADEIHFSPLGHKAIADFVAMQQGGNR